MVSDLRPRGSGFDPRPAGRCCVTTVGKLFTPMCLCHHTHTHTHPFNGPLSRTTRVGRYQKGKTSLDFTEARDSEWQ